MNDGKNHKISYHFENRLFDRDTLILQTYNINFLFVLACYVQGAGEHTQEIRRIFRENIKTVLQKQYDFYALTPRESINAEEFLKENFQQLLGKVFAPYRIEEPQPYYSLALDQDAKFQEEKEFVLNLVETGFYCKPCSLGQDPREVLPIVVQPTKETMPPSLLTTHHIQRYSNQHFLVGCYNSEEQLAWIMGKNDKGTNLYNVRLKRRGDTARDGALQPTYLASLDVKFVILYKFGEENQNEYRVFHVHHNATMNEERMRKAMYPNPQGNYFCYVFDEEVQLSTRINLSEIISNAKSSVDYVDGMPIFMTGKELSSNYIK